MTALHAPIAPIVNELDTQEFRKTLGCFATGVAVVTTCGSNGRPVGLTISSFNSVSMAPPLILWSLSLNSPSLPAFRDQDCFAVNILSAEQVKLARHFATPQDNKFDNVDWSWGPTGAPLLADCSAVLQCRSYRRYEGGDHEIFLGEVIGLDMTELPGLVFSRGIFCQTEQVV